jgi:hypothetical protein
MEDIKYLKQLLNNWLDGRIMKPEAETSHLLA